MKLFKPLLTLLFSVWMTLAYAQKPTVAPKPQDSHVDFSKPENIIIYIVLPIVFIVLYFIWRSNKRKEERQKELENLNNNQKDKNLD